MRQEYTLFKSRISKLKIGSEVINSAIKVGNHTIGQGQFSIIAGPCAVESKTQINVISQLVKQQGAHLLRAGAFKPRTSPYSFQGLGLEGLQLLKQVKETFNIPIVTEMMNEKEYDIFEEIVDLIQIGSRNMQNFDLLKKVGQGSKPVMLKRGLNATLEEFLLAAEYIVANGNRNIILCERGIRSYDNVTRNVLDLSAVAILKQVTNCPVIVDPSHATGITEIIPTMSLAAKSTGADGIMVEVHHNVKAALSDADQALSPSVFAQLAKAVA